MKPILLAVLCTLLLIPAHAQTITGVWRGNLHKQKLELKLIKSGDSLSGTVYYYTSKTQYTRYSVKGYFDPETNEVIWWDDLLLDDAAGRGTMEAQLSVADFNCPGADELLLDGNSNQKEDKDSEHKSLHLQKVPQALFSDEWDWVIDNYFVGTNHPRIIDSVNQLQGRPEYPEEKEVVARKPVVTVQPGPKVTPAVMAPPLPASASNQEKFRQRKKQLQTVIPVDAETIELRFYDNAQVDGDSIALFLNDRLIFEHIRLTDKAYTVTLKASDLGPDNELVMVAENLGSIPPNTSFMVALVGGKRYEARLFANENSSAMIRLVKNE